MNFYSRPQTWRSLRLSGKCVRGAAFPEERSQRVPVLAGVWGWKRPTCCCAPRAGAESVSRSGRCLGLTRNHRPVVSFPPDFVGSTFGCGPVFGVAPTVTLDPLPSFNRVRTPRKSSAKSRHSKNCEVAFVAIRLRRSCSPTSVRAAHQCGSLLIVEKNLQGALKECEKNLPSRMDFSLL